MVIWGAICGAVLFGMFWRGDGFPVNLVGGAMLGAVAGLTLRNAIRAEVQRVMGSATVPRAQAVVPVPVPAAPPRAAAPPPPATPEPARAAEWVDTVSPPDEQVPPRPPAPPREPNLVTVLVMKARDWLLGGNTVVRVGVLVLFVGLAFLAKYAVDNSLLPPELRLAAIAAAGIGLFAAGFRLRAKPDVHRGYALTLQGAGVAVMYLTVFAAFRLYQFLPAPAAFAALALVCAFSAAIAVAQNAQAMAFIGFAGGFAAPILVSTGQGNHVSLFSYYLLLGVAIAGLAWWKAWRPLNLLGFFATFAVATAWGVLRYRPEDFATTEPFLVAFYAVYLAAALMYALRHSLAAARAVDATLVFGVPLIGFSLQAALVRDMEYAAAFSSLALGALYLALTAWMVRTRGREEGTRDWLAQCFLALGLGFTTLAVPLALDARWTSAVWAIEGAGVYWMGRRQGRWLARFAGLLLQVLAGIALLDALPSHAISVLPLAHPGFIGSAVLAAAALFIAFQARTPSPATGGRMDAALASFEEKFAPFLFWIGFLWWQFALHTELERTTIDAQSAYAPAYGEALRQQLRLVGWVASAFVAHYFALPGRRQPWSVAATPAWTVLPVMFAGALLGAATLTHVFVSGGWIAWPVVLLLHGVMLRRLDSGAPQGWWPWVHAGGVWLMVLLAGNLLVYAVGKGQLWQTAWATVILLVAGIAVLLLLSSKACFRAAQARNRWPLDRFGRAYLWTAATPLAACVALGCLAVAVHSDGNARPLPYIPLLNPSDLAIALGLVSCAMWLARIRASSMDLPGAMRGKGAPLALAAIAFIALNTVWLRVAHHYGGVPWNAPDLFASFLVQAGYSILWTSIAVLLMVVAHRRALRPVWMLGGGLLALTVLKLFVIDLSNRGGSERIVVFIAVGVLMLVVGYFAPMPPSDSRAGSRTLPEAAT
jgi:uncharacterized membrane protein